MSIYLEGVEDNEGLNRIGSFSPIYLDSKVHVDEMEEKEGNLIRKTVAQMPHITAHTPNFIDKSLEGRVTLGPPQIVHAKEVSLNQTDNPRPIPIEALPETASLAEIQSQINKYANLVDEQAEEAQQIRNSLIQEDTKEFKEEGFPFLAWESLKYGLHQEKVVNAKLQEHIKEAEEHQKNIKLLLDLSSQLSGYKEETNEMSPQMKDLLTQLKERNIDLWKSEDQKLTKEKISELKSLSSSQVDNERSLLQILFTNKMQVLLQLTGTIMEMLKDIIRNNTKLINAANRLPGR